MQQIPVESLVDALPQLGADPVLLDVREDWEVGVSSLTVPGLRTVHIPMGQIVERLPELQALPDDTAIVCLCHHGMRSLQVALFLERQGLGPVFNLHGGIDAWSQRVDATVPRY